MSEDDHEMMLNTELTQPASCKYNLLTQRLLAEGYSAENYPDYVRLPKSYVKGEPFCNMIDGFEYIPEYRNRMVFQTGCGLLVKGSQFSSGHMCWKGITWIPENDNPTVCCPYRKENCLLRNPMLNEMGKIFNCDCHRTEMPYDYEKSLDKVRDEMEQKKKLKYEKFCKEKRGHVCPWTTRYDEEKGEWWQTYDPEICAEYCKGGQLCGLTQKNLSKKRGNVYYDLKITYARQDDTVFAGQMLVTIHKGVKLFKTSKSMTICEATARRKRKIQDKINLKYHSAIYLRGWKVEVMNIRAEQRESKNVMQDLEDKKAGITVIHDSDLDKQKKAEKKERRKKSRQKKIENLENKILAAGYDNLGPYSLERLHADKWLGKERIQELELQRAKAEREKPVQMRLSDFGIHIGDA